MAPHPPDPRPGHNLPSSMTVRIRGVARIVVDVGLYLAVNAVLAVLHTQVQPFHRGFFCQDDSIHYPYRGDTVTIVHLLLAGLLAPILVIILLEFLSKVVYGRRKQQRGRQFLHSVVRLGALFLYGGALTMVVSEAVKLTAGRLRPHFLDTCRPDIDFHNCSHEYITDFQCSSDVPEDLSRDARKSFPSGHAAIAGYVSVFIVIHVEYRLKLQFSLFLKSLLQVGVLVLATLCAVSRVNDNRHHWSDVIAGAILGVLMAFWTLFCLPRHMQQQQDNIHQQPAPAMRQLSTTETVMLDDHTFLYTPTSIGDLRGSRSNSRTESRPSTPTSSKVPRLLNP